MRIRAALLTLLFLVPAVAGAAGPGVDPTAQLATIEQQAAHIRQLRPTAPVKAVFPSDARFNALWDTELHSDSPAAEVAMNQREAVELGLLRKSDSLRHILFGQSASQIAGFYDYHHKVLYVRNGPNGIFGPSRYVIAHEYTHALQDQHFGLSALLPDQWPLSYRNSDAVAAHHALTEGDAVTLESVFIDDTYTRKDLDALARMDAQIAVQQAKGPSLPASMQHELYFPYTTGRDFVLGLYRSGGMKAINAAYKRLPSSTYEIMYPAAYRAHWQPVQLPIHGVTGFPGWNQVDDDVNGAFGYDLVLWQFVGKAKAMAVLKGYRGDRYLFLEKGNKNAMLLKSVWTSPAAARAARELYLASLRARWRHAVIRHGPPIMVVNGGTAVYLRTTGSELTIAYAPTVAIATQLATGPTS